MATINCDMDEAFGLYRMGDEAGLMPLIDIANVACGFHASDFNHMRSTVRLALPRCTRETVGNAARGHGATRLCPPFCNGPLVNPFFALSARRVLASVRGRRVAAT